MANYLFLRGNRNKRFFIDIAQELIERGHECYQIKFELGELLYSNSKSKITTVFAPFHVSNEQYNIPDEALLNLPIYNITYKKKILNKDTSTKELAMYKRYMYFIDRFIEEKNIDVICLFNGYHWIDQVTRIIADKRGIDTQIFEDGLFRPYTITCDPKGINAQASVPRLPSFYDSVQIDKERLEHFLFKPEKKNMYNRVQENILLVALIKFISMLGEYFRIAPKLYAHISFTQAVKYFLFKKKFKYQKHDEVELPEEYIFLPFQVARDTQIFYNSPTIKTMEQLLEIVKTGVDELNKNENRNVKIIVKEHPEDISRNNYRNLKKRYEQNNDVIFIQKYNINKLISNSLAIITVNSTVGIEALAKYKRVITLGDALYNIGGIATHCDNPERLGEVISQSLKAKLNIDRIEKFLYYLRFTYQIEGTINTPNLQTAKNVADRIQVGKK